LEDSWTNSKKIKNELTESTFQQKRWDCLESSDIKDNRWRTVDSDIHVDFAGYCYRRGYNKISTGDWQYEFKLVGVSSSWPSWQDEIRWKHCKHFPCFIQVDQYFGCEQNVICGRPYSSFSNDYGDEIPGVFVGQRVNHSGSAFGSGEKYHCTYPHQMKFVINYSYGDILDLTKRSNTCGMNSCTSRVLEYSLFYDPIAQNLDQLATMGKTLILKTGKYPPFEITFENKVVLGGMVVAMKGGKDGKYCKGEQNNIKCQQDKIGDSEKFLIEDAGDKTIAFKGGHDQKYCTVNSFNKKMQCKGDSLGEREKFYVFALAGGNFAFKHMSSQKYCTDTGSGIKCSKKKLTRSRNSSWSK